jgi:hypothetical protein
MNLSFPRTLPGSAAISRIRGEFWLPALAFCLYGLILVHYSAPYAAGSDSSGYLNSARLLSQGNLSVPMRQVPGLNPETLSIYTYCPLGFNPRPDYATLVPSYSIGLPLLLAFVAQGVGWNLGPLLAMVLHALFGLWLVYRLGRELGLEPGWAWVGPLLLAASPLYIYMSLVVMSDVPATVWVTAAVLAAWKSRERPGLAALAGASLSLALLLRPTDLLAFIPMAIALGFSMRRWLLLAAGGLPGAIILGVVNHVAYGRFLTTGYGDLSTLFSARNVPMTMVHYAVWMPALFTPLVVIAVGLPALRPVRLRAVAVLAAWVFAFFAFYLFYDCTHESWWYLRFILPATPPLLVAALLVGRAAAERLRLTPRAWWLGLAVLLAVVSGSAWFRHFDLSFTRSNERCYPDSTAWMRSHLPANAVVASMQTSGALLYYTDFTFFRWDMVSPADFQRIATACAAAGRPLYASLYPFEIKDRGVFRDHLAGHWTRIAEFGNASIWCCDSIGAAR